MTEVSWEIKYNISIKGIGGGDAFHLKEALKERSAKRPQQTPVVFERIIDICDRIITLDDRN